MALFRLFKNTKKPLFGQILSLIPKHILNFQIQKYKSDKGCSKYKTYDQLVTIIFGQLNKCYSLFKENWAKIKNRIFFETLFSENNSKMFTPIKGVKGKTQVLKQRDLAYESAYSKAVSIIRQPIESFFNWINEKTQIQNASKVRSTNGLIVHVFGKLNA